MLKSEKPLSKEPQHPKPPSFGIMDSLFGSSSKPKQEQKPQPKGPFGGADLVPVKDIMREARMREAQHKGVVIPGTGEQKMTPEQYRKLLEKRIPPYQKTGSHLSELERKNILRRMRHEDKGIPSRERRVLEQEWGLGGKY